MDNLQALHSNILNTYEQIADEAFEGYKFSSLYGKKSEARLAKAKWDEAVAVVVAVDSALFEMRFQIRSQMERVEA